MHGKARGFGRTVVDGIRRRLCLRLGEAGGETRQRGGETLREGIGGLDEGGKFLVGDCRRHYELIQSAPVPSILPSRLWLNSFPPDLTRPVHGGAIIQWKSSPPHDPHFIHSLEERNQKD